MAANGSQGFAYWLARFVLVTLGIVGIWISESRLEVWRRHYQETFEFDPAIWIQLFLAAVLSGLLVGLAAALPLRRPYRWANVLAFGLLPAIGVVHFVFLWWMFSTGVGSDLPEVITKMRLFDAPGPQAVFMFLIGLSLVSGFFGSREPAPVVPAAPAAPEA